MMVIFQQYLGLVTETLDGVAIQPRNFVVQLESVNIIRIHNINYLHISIKYLHIGSYNSIKYLHISSYSARINNVKCLCLDESTGP